MSDVMSRFRVLPLLVLVAMLTFGVRMGEAITDVKDLTASALAETEPAAGDLKKPGAAEEAAKTEAVKDAAANPDAKADDKNAAKTAPAKPDASPADPEGPQPSAQPDVALPDATLPEVWADPSAQDMNDSPEQMRLLEDLAKRREQLDAREKNLDTREALMKATEKQIDEKIGEMTALKDQIEKLLGQQETEEADKIKSLVKIYEGMKAKSAAEIFNQMDMNVLLQVISKMSERKSAPIIAAMDPARANELTVRLTEMKKLPELRQGESMGTHGGPMPTNAPAGSASLPGLDALGKPR